MPLDVNTPGQMEAVFERIAKEWGKLDFVVHSIAFSPKDALQGRVVDVSRDGFLTTMDVSVLDLHSHGASGGAADAQGRDAVHDDVLRQPDGGEELQHHGRRQGGAGERGPLHGGGARPEGHPRPRHLARPAGDPGRIRHSGIRRLARQGEGEGAGAQPRQHRRRRRRDRFPRPRCRAADHRRDASTSTAAITSSISSRQRPTPPRSAGRPRSAIL